MVKNIKEKKQESENKMEKITALAKKRGFVFAGSEIYGGMANSWDYGPLGVELKNNIKARWWEKFVKRRADVVGIETALIMNTKVWEASGHLKEFSDPLVDCKDCKERFRADETEGKCPSCGSKNHTEARNFNLMFKTFIGPVDDGSNTAYFRPETAQGMFVNFKNVSEATRKKIPFGIAQIGKAFRNEITPGNFIFRTREFEQMEIEYFIDKPKTKANWEKFFEMWRKEMVDWMGELGINTKEEIVEFEVPKEERAHYSERTIDFMYKFPFGEKELYGLAYRTDFDLKNHSNASGEDLSYRDEKENKIIPHVIEPTFGVERSVLATICSAYTEELAKTADGGVETRVVLKLPKWLAPIKVAVLPLSKKEELAKPAKKAYEEFLKAGIMAEYDETQSIGKRYRRQDEIGTPYCVTFDFESLKDKAVTVRDRDTMKQERIEIKKVIDYLKDKLEER